MAVRFSIHGAFDEGDAGKGWEQQVFDTSLRPKTGGVCHTIATVASRMAFWAIARALHSPRSLITDLIFSGESFVMLVSREISFWAFTSAFMPR